MNKLYLETALKVVLESADLVEEASQREIIYSKDTPRDGVTKIDIEVSNLILSKLQDLDIAIICEEINIPKKLPYEFWVVDPIDGTVNYSHGNPHYAISVGLVRNNQFVIGVVCAPSLNELYFTLTESKPIFNGRPYRYNDKEYHEALFSYSLTGNQELSIYEAIKQINEETRGCLRTGSAALNICHVSSGRIQAAFGFKARIWDVAASFAIAKAAGCDIFIFNKNELELDYIVGSKKLITKIKSIICRYGVVLDA